VPEEVLTEDQKLQHERLAALGILKSRYTHLENQVYGTYRAAVEKDAGYYELTFADDLVPTDWKRKGISAVVPPTAYNAVENAVDHILVTPKVAVPVRPSSANFVGEQAIAERKRLALRFWWDQVSVDNGGPISSAVKSLIKDGKMVLKKTIKWDLIPDEVDDDQPIGLDEFPWDLEAIPPEAIYEDPDRPYDPMYVYENYTTSVGAAKESYPEGLASWRSGEDHDDVKVMEFYSKPKGTSRGQHAIWVDDEPVVDTINPYSWRTLKGDDENPEYAGYLPYIIRASGWGERKHKYEPEKYYVGILRRMHSLLEAQAGHLTDGSVQMKYSTFPAVLTSMPESVPINIGPGEVTRKSQPDDTVEFVRPPDLPSSLFRILDQVAAEANGLSKFDALGGTAVRGVDTATESDNQIRNASAKLNSPILAMRSALTQINKQILQDVENVLEQPVLLFGAPDEGESLVVLDPEEIKGFYHTTIELTTTDRAALDRAVARLWADLYRSFPGMSEKLAMTNAGIDDPQRVQEERLEEDTFRSPRMAQVRDLAALVAMGESAKTVLAAAQQQLQGEAEQAEQGAAGAGQDASLGDNAQAPQPGQQAVTQGQVAALESRSDLESQ
jgi:hypothetical protein